jgi:NAD(P)-dependent dehydrogenase (short-subunit alcohol dehydrogenase family)
VVADLNAEGAEHVVDAIEAAGGTALAVTGDLSETAVVVAAAVGTFGGIDVLVNNAGVMDTMSAAADVTDAEWERVLRINLTAPFLLSRAVLPHMIAAGGGAIVNTASEASLRGSAAGTAYTASKHGVLGLTRSF